MSSSHPWSWLTVFQCGVLERVAISCCVAMHVPLRSKLNCLSNKAPRRCLFFYILALRTNCPVGPSITKLFMYQSSFSLPPLSLLYPPLPSLACLDFFFSLVTAQVPVLLLFKKYSGLFLGFLFLFVLLLLFELLVTSTSAPNLSLILEGAQFYFIFLLSIVQIFICIRALQRSFVFSSKMLFFVALLLCYRYWHQFPDVVFLSV